MVKDSLSFGAARLILLFPWLVFIGLGLSMARLMYEAWQEQAALEALGVKIRQERALLEQKNNFIRLSSHYLRNPLTLITAGIEAMAFQRADSTLIAQLKQIGQRLNLGVNGLLEQAAPQAVKPTEHPKQKLPNLTVYLGGSLAGALLVISLAVYLLNHLDFSEFKLNSLAAESGLLLLGGTLAYGIWRTRANRQLVKSHFEELLAEQRTLDKQRNELVKGSLDSLQGPLNELKAQLRPLGKQTMVRPVLQGLALFESVLERFIILASLEAGTLSRTNKRVSLKEMMARISERYRLQLEQKQVQIRTQLGSVELEQDELLLEFVLNSVIDNAVQYSPEGGFIDVISRQSGDYVDVFVRDQGPGVPKDKLATLFKPFSRVEDVEKQFEHQGIGLSLYLDRLIMRYLGGGIKAETALGKGMTIKLRISSKVELNN